MSIATATVTTTTRTPRANNQETTGTAPGARDPHQTTTKCKPIGCRQETTRKPSTGGFNTMTNMLSLSYWLGSREFGTRPWEHGACDCPICRTRPTRFPQIMVRVGALFRVRGRKQQVFTPIVEFQSVYHTIWGKSEDYTTPNYTTPYQYCLLSKNSSGLKPQVPKH